MIADPDHLATAAGLREGSVRNPAAGAHLQFEVQSSDLSAYDALQERVGRLMATIKRPASPLGEADKLIDML